MVPFRIALLALLCLPSTAALAQDATPTAPAGPFILTVIGLNANVFPHGKVELDPNQLQAMPQAEITTSTIWTDGPHLYKGVLLRTLIDQLQIEGPQKRERMLRLTALNDYEIQMPTTGATARAPLLAYLVDGKQMTVRDKGPIWIIYPYDSDAKYRTIKTFDRSVWQLAQIEVLP